MSIFLSLTYKHPDDREARQIEKDYRAVMKDLLKFTSYREAKTLFIKTAIGVMKGLQAHGKVKAGTIKKPAAVRKPAPKAAAKKASADKKRK